MYTNQPYQKNATGGLFQTMIFLFLLSGLLFAQGYDYGKHLTDEEKTVAAEWESQYLHPDQHKVLRILGDGVIERDDLVDGDVVVVKGTLILKGRVKGNVLALFSELELVRSAEVQGAVVCVDGKIWRESGAVIAGDIIEKDTGMTHERIRHSRRYGRQDDEDDYPDPSKREWKYQKDLDEGLDGFWFDYNRVYGLTLGWNLPKLLWWEQTRRPFGLYGKIGYGFAAKRGQYQIGLQRRFFNDQPLSFGGDYHDLCDTEDRWIIGDTENSLAALFLREDFRDYYRKTGYNLFISQTFLQSVNIRLDYKNDDIRNLERKTNWSVFGGKKKFHPNPDALPVMAEGMDPVTSRNLESVQATVELDTRDSHTFPQSGWYLQAFGEQGKFTEADGLSFDRYIIDLRRYQQLGWDENLDIRLRAGTSQGVLPPMYWFDLGGISTLRGYRFKEFTGDRMVLANVEYRMNTAGSDWFLLDDFDLILFVDSGCAWFANGHDPAALSTYPVDAGIRARTESTTWKDDFDTLTWSKMRTNVGLGLASRSGDFRIDVAKPTDHRDSDLVVTLRIKKPF